MKYFVNVIFFLMSLFWTNQVHSQRLNVGFTFQYLVLKQVKVDADVVYGSNSYSLYYVKDNRWKLFSAGQSIVVGTVIQLDYKKLYIALEPSFDLNTYQYRLDYPLSAQKYEHLNFQTLFMQTDIPLYAGFQLKSSNLVRYSIFAGVDYMMPFVIETDLSSRLVDNPQYMTYNSGDLNEILYNVKPYLNSLVGIGFHFASLVKLDVRYIHRLNSPGVQYNTTFNTIGVALTYYLPLSFRKRKIYYED